MSVFNKVMTAHQDAKTAAEHDAAAAAAARSEAEARFALEFAEQVRTVAQPIFEKFAADAVAFGFPATTENAHDGKANPIYGVRVVPRKEAQLGSDASEEIVYTLKGIVDQQKVEHGSFFDQRPGRNGVKKAVFGIMSINKELLERELGQFLSAALKARAS